MSLLFNDYYKRFSLGSAFYFNVLLKGENTAIHIYTYRHGYTSAHALSQAVICSLLSSGLQRSHLDNSPDLISLYLPESPFFAVSIYYVAPRWDNNFSWSFPLIVRDRWETWRKQLTWIAPFRKCFCHLQWLWLHQASRCICIVTATMYPLIRHVEGIDALKECGT